MKGRFGDRKGHQEAGKKGGIQTSVKYGTEFYKKIGHLGGISTPSQFKKNDSYTRKMGYKGGKKRYGFRKRNPISSKDKKVVDK